MKPISPRGKERNKYRQQNNEQNNKTTITILWPFVRDYPGEPVPEETLTHPSS